MSKYVPPALRGRGDATEEYADQQAAQQDSSPRTRAEGGYKGGKSKGGKGWEKGDKGDRRCDRQGKGGKGRDREGDDRPRLDDGGPDRPSERRSDDRNGKGGRRYNDDRRRCEDGPRSGVDHGSGPPLSYHDRFTRNEWGNVDEDISMDTLFKNTRHNTGLNFDKVAEISVDVKGGTVENPMKSFDEIDLHPSLRDNIERAGYKKPTPVQKYALPIVLGGKDLMACAQTGSGKTAAFLLPIVNSFLKEGPTFPTIASVRRPEGILATEISPRALVIVPTRELALQIHQEARKFCFRTGLRSVVVYGGAIINDQLQDVCKGCQILVATPGRLIDLLENRRDTKGGGYKPRSLPDYKNCFLCLHRARFLCLDEADRMLDLGFEDQVRAIVEKHDLPPVSQRVTMMFSATFPDSIQRLAKDFLGERLFVTVGKIGSTNTGITQRLEYCSDSNKCDFLVGLLQRMPSKQLVLVFVDTRKDVNRLEKHLLQNGLKASSIHGDKDQAQREESLRMFKRGEVPILVATDVASRGLDIPNISHVVQYDLPHNLDDYTHRIGRTGRAGNTGLATAFFNERNRGILEDLLQYLQQHDQDVPQQLVDLIGRGKGGKGDRGERRNGRRNGKGSQSQVEQPVVKQEPAFGGNMYYAMMDSGGGAY